MSFFFFVRQADSKVSDCGSFGCAGTHSITKRNNFFEKYFVLTWKEVFELSQCLLKERDMIYAFCNKCIDCRRYIFYNEQVSSMKMLQERNIYITLCLVKPYNIKYPRWRPHTVHVMGTKCLFDKRYIVKNWLDL